MLRIFESVTTLHDPMLVLLAAVICAFGAISTMNVSSRAVDSGRFVPWMLVVALCAACTAWATQFISLLGYRQDLAATYDPRLTGLSFLGGALIMGPGFLLAIRGSASRNVRLLGGAIVGAGVVVVHSAALGALRLPGRFGRDADLAVAAALLGVGLGALTLSVAFKPGRPRRLPGALLMVATLLAVHFTGTGALRELPGLVMEPARGGLSPTVLAMVVSIAPLSVLLIGLLGAVIDQRVSWRLAAEADRFRTLADGAFEGLVVHRGGVVVDANVAARRLFGLPEDDPESDLGPLLMEALEHADAGATSRDELVEVDVRRRDGSAFPAELCRRRIKLSDGREGELCAIRDLTVRRETEARIAHMALHDALTGLPNRRFFMELAGKVMSQSQRSHQGFALLALDLDDLKNVNDTYGHAAGDEVIRATTKRILATLRDTDIAARFGGDEFAVLQTGVTQPEQTTILAERLLDALRTPVRTEYGEVAITASVGIAVYPGDGATVEELLRNADTAMYRAKADGKAAIRFFEAHMNAELVARRTLEGSLRRAVAENRLTVAYQPIVESHSREPIGFEALARWTDPELGVISPAEFIPVAETTGLVVPIAEFVLREACFQAATWPSHLLVAVNLSPVQFRRPGLVQTVRSALRDSGLAGERLELEVTETLLIDNSGEALRLLRELKALGVRISMDDFGTGYSALSYLQSFPFDKIKIDRIFVTDLAVNPQNASIVRAVAAMGRSLKMRVVAEGVETHHAAEMLKGLDCDELQGYLIARPMDGEDVGPYLEKHARSSARKVSHRA